MLKKIKVLISILLFTSLFLITKCMKFQKNVRENKVNYLYTHTVFPQLPVQDSLHQWNREIGLTQNRSSSYAREVQESREQYQTSKHRRVTYKKLENKQTNAMKISPFIINGAIATEGQIKNQVVLLFTNTTDQNEQAVFCGGSLISLKCVLTAAHCCVKKTGQVKVRVIAGAVDLSKTNTCKQELTSTRIISHTKFNPTNLNNDICCIFLGTPFNKTDCVEPICVSNSSTKTYEKETATVSGYGKTAVNATGISYQLMWTNMSVISNVQCSTVYGRQTVISSVLCCNNTMNPAINDTSRTCNGDSGGPLMFYNSSSNTQCQIGVVSFGPGNPPCASGLPSGFTRVTSFIQWLKSIKAIFTMCSC